jgi:hypothetical protein
VTEQVRTRQRRVLQAPSERHHQCESEDKGAGRNQTGPNVQRAEFSAPRKEAWVIAGSFPLQSRPVI